MAKDSKGIKPWERQDEETTKQFEAFVVYRDMGENRSLVKVANKLGKSEQLMSRWSSANKWVERVNAWDDERERIMRQEQIKDIKNMRKRHADLAYAGLLKMAQAMKQMKPEDFKPSDIPRFAEAFSKLERISRGDVGDVVEERQGEAVDPVQIYIPSNGRERENTNFDDLEV